MDLFNNEVLVGYDKGSTLPLAIEGLYTDLFFTNFKADVGEAYQINYSLAGDTYSYVFGTKLSMCMLTGIAFSNRACSLKDKQGKQTVKMASIPKNFIKLYNKHKIGSGEILRISIGGMVIAGYFVNMQINLVAGKENTYTFTCGFLGRVN
jgi:hypothetical protein